MKRILRIACAVLFFAVAAFAPAADRMNVLWISGDDHAPYMSSVWGNPRVRMPNLESLAARGLRFDRAYCNSPVCTASRQSYLTGRYPWKIRVTELATPLPESAVTLADLLGEAGYETAAAGKMHFNSNLKHGFEVRLDSPDHAAAMKGKPRAPLPEGLETYPLPWRPFKDPARQWLNARALPQPAADEEMPDTWFAREAESFLKRERADPFFLMVSFTAPHSPFHFPVEFAGLHRAEEFEAPEVLEADRAQIPAVFRDLTDGEKQGIQAAYATSAEFLDKNIGRVLEALGSAGLEANTLVIYSSDHGYMLGQHGRFEKHCMYEEAARTALVISLPGGRAGKATSALVELVDLAPTILEACGAPLPDDLDGKSLIPLLKGTTDRHRERVITTYHPNEEAMIRDEGWKLVYAAGKTERTDGYSTGLPLPGRTIRLFNGAEDPQELRNLAPRPDQAGRIAAMARALAEAICEPAGHAKSAADGPALYDMLDEALIPPERKPINSAASD